MRHFTCAPEIEFIGQNLRAFTDNLQGDEVGPIVAKYGLANADPNGWYKARPWMDAMNELAQHPNFSSNMVAIGMKIGEIVPMPPTLPNPTLGEVLQAWDGIYQYIHRGGDVGKIVCTKIDDKHYTTTHTDLYPDDFSYGIVYGYARRFLPRGARFKVHYDEEVKPRDHGGPITIIHVRWE
jgi:hypothetical protein